MPSGRLKVSAGNNIQRPIWSHMSKKSWWVASTVPCTFKITASAFHQYMQAACFDLHENKYAKDCLAAFSIQLKALVLVRQAIIGKGKGNNIKNILFKAFLWEIKSPDSVIYSMPEWINCHNLVQDDRRSCRTCYLHRKDILNQEQIRGRRQFPWSLWGRALTRHPCCFCKFLFV